jgi:hypothetical protein
VPRPRQYWETEGLCESPHDDPPKWAGMVTAYLDETGLHQRGLVVVSGFLGRRTSWDKLAEEWPKGFEGSSQRKSLHVKDLKFKYESERLLLEKLGPIPEQCGLVRVSGSVDESDYMDLAKGTVSEIHAHGYALAMGPLIMAIEAAIPDNERYELIFEKQDALGFYRDRMLEMIRSIMPSHPHYRSHPGRPRKVQLAHWRDSMPGETFLTEPADYLCSHLYKNSTQPPDSVEVAWTKPIMGNGKITIRHFTREAVRNLFLPSGFLSNQDQQELRDFKKTIREGSYDPWKELIEKREKRHR